MSDPQPPLPTRSTLLLDFAIILYSALRARQFYPTSNPQVRRSNDLVLKAFQALLGSGENSVNIAISDRKILVCGQHLPDRDQKRQQIQGLITLFSRLKIHSFTFQSTFALDDCVKFIQILSEFLGKKELTEPISTLLNRAGISSITVDTKRYVAIHEGEQVVREEMIGSGLNISDEELANFVLGKTRKDPLQAVSPELVKELINRLPEATGRHQPPEGLTEAVIEVLQNLSKETDFRKRASDLEQSAHTLSGLNSAQLANLVAHLPATPVADEIVDSTLQQLTPQQLNALIANLAAQQATQAGTALGTGPQNPASGQVDPTAFNRMLGHYEQLLTKEQQTQVAQQAGAQLASMEGLALGNLIAQKFKGLFGQQLYRHVMTQVSDELLDETVEHLTPKQLNRMIATLTSDIPLLIGKDDIPGYIPADDAILKRLVETKKGPEITTAIARNIDVRQLLLNPSTTLAQLPGPLLQRLTQPEWSAPILVTAVQQSTDPDNYKNGKADFTGFEHMLEQYDTLLNSQQQAQVAQQAASEIAAFDEKELGLILVQRYKSLFGEQLYRQVINQLSVEKLGKLTGQLQTIAEGQKNLPPNQQDKEIEEAYKRLLQTVRSEKMRAIIQMHQEQKILREQEHQKAIENGLYKLLHEEFNCLETKEFSQSLPETVKNLLNEGKEYTTDNLLMQLASALQHNNATVRANAAQALAAIAGQLADIGQWQRLGKLLPALQQGLRLEGIEPENIHLTLTAIGGLAGHYLEEESYSQATELTHYLQTLVSKDGTTTDIGSAIREQALATLKHLNAQPVLGQLLDRYLHSEPHQEIVGKLLIELGAESAKFQLQQLLSNESRFERKRLLALIKQTGNQTIPLLLEQLHEDAPWFVIRNVIHLLGEIGNPTLFAAITPFIGHPDLRVQQEVISSAAKIDGEDFKDFLLQALQTVSDSLKVKVVHHIGTIHDERFVHPLTDLLESTKPFLGKNKNDLHLALCKALGAIGSKRAASSLTRVVQSKKILGLAGYSEEVRQAAKQALERIQKGRSAPGDRESGENVGHGEPARRTTAMVTEVPVGTTATEETEIFAMVAEGKPDQAKLRLLDLISATARAGNFPTAERLRDRIYEIDSMALGEIIRAGEIIEQEKKGAIKGEDLEIWASLTDRLSSEEFLTIYHEFNEHLYKPEETIVKQGDKNDALFFINQGSLKVSHLVGTRELFITSLNRGQIAGENFFTPSFWTITLTALTPSKVYILQQAALNSWQEQFPGLRTKLHEYYTACNNIPSILAKKGLERRRDQRFTLMRKIQVQPIDKLDQPIGREFRAETADISLGGLAFLIRISRQENARLLLGRRLQIILPVGGKTRYLRFKGLVIGIQPFHLQENDFSAHFTFDQPLEQEKLQTILG